MARRATVVLVSVALSSSAMAAAFAAPEGHAAAGKSITGKKTTIVLSSPSHHALKAHHFTLEANGPARYKAGTLTLPVTGGTYDGPLDSVVKQGGGFTISKGSKSVSINKLVDHTNSLSATARVSGHGRIAAVTIGIPGSSNATDTTATFADYQVTLSKQLVKVLDTTFGTRQFARHATIGTGTTKLTFS